MKKVAIIGAGIAGLTCGIYAQLNGFDTEIYEMHTIPGGECTGWDRKGYHFDGCIHWLVGTKPGTGLGNIWRDTGALDDSVRVIDHDVFIRYEEEGGAVNFYTNAGKLEAHLTRISPEDRGEIKKFCAAIRAVGGFGMPVDKPMDMMKMGDGLKFAVRNMGAISKMSRYGKMTVEEFCARFKSPLLQRAMEAAIPVNTSPMPLIMTMAGMNGGDCGYPEGGSRALAYRMEKKFLSLGGKVFYKAKSERIKVEDGKATGIVLANGREIVADHVISCADGYNTLKVLLEDKYTPDVYNNLFGNPKEYPTITSALVFMGVDADIKSETRAIQIRREAPVSLNGVKSKCVQLISYGFDKNMASEGKSVFSCYYEAEYDYWKALAADKEKYEAEKKRLAEDATAALIRRFPETEGKIEVTDVVTPMTYERYAGAWRGAWMTWAWGGKDVPRYHPGVLTGLENFIMAGMWTLPPGGLPGAGASGRFAAHRLCIQNGMEFKTE
jgi:phytoene dehydrogenase-like protein